MTIICNSLVVAFRFAGWDNFTRSVATSTAPSTDAST